MERTHSMKLRNNKVIPSHDKYNGQFFKLTPTKTHKNIESKIKKFNGSVQQHYETWKNDLYKIRSKKILLLKNVTDKEKREEIETEIENIKTKIDTLTSFEKDILKKSNEILSLIINNKFVNPTLKVDIVEEYPKSIMKKKKSNDGIVPKFVPYT